MDQQRLILLVVFGFSLVMLWEGWQKYQHPQRSATPVVATQNAASGTVPEVPVATNSNVTSTAPAVPGAIAAAPVVTGETLLVTTDTLKARIAAQGGNIVHLELLQHKETADDSRNFVLFDTAKPHVYMAESGLIGEGLPTHKTVYTFVPGDYELKPGTDKMEVRLKAPEVDGIQVTKILTFSRGSYVIDVSYEIVNQGAAALAPYAYFQLARDGKPAESDSKMVRTFTGAAVYTDAEKYRKLDFSDIEKGKVKLPSKVKDGWIGITQYNYY